MDVNNLLAESFKDVELRKIDFLRWVSRPFQAAMLNTDVPDESVSKAVEIYRVLWGSIADEAFRGNSSNNELLALASQDAAITNKLEFYRFVCMPWVKLKTSNGMFDGWSYEVGTYGYDTLTPAMPADLTLFNALEGIVDTKITFILDDWEVPYLRTTDYKKPGYSILSSMSQSQQLLALESLEGMREDVSKWINVSVVNYLVGTDILYFSKLIGYKSFLELLSEFEINFPENAQKLLNAEMAFVRESARRDKRTMSEFEIRIKAMRRISQYAVEGSILLETFGNSVFLCSEYPVAQVLKKLTLISDIPALFYAKDSDVKNI